MVNLIKGCKQSWKTNKKWIFKENYWWSISINSFWIQIVYEEIFDINSNVWFI